MAGLQTSERSVGSILTTWTCATVDASSFPSWAVCAAVSTVPSSSPSSCLSRRKIFSLSLSLLYTFTLDRKTRRERESEFLALTNFRTNFVPDPGKTARSHGSRARLSERTELLFVVCCASRHERRRGGGGRDRERRRREGRKKKAERRRSRGPLRCFALFFRDVTARRGEARKEGKEEKNEEDNARSRVGAVLNGNGLASVVPGSWVTWRQGDTVAPPTVRWICRLAARLPQGRSFRGRTRSPSGRRDACRLVGRKEERIYHRHWCSLSSAAAFTLRG